MDTAEKNFSRDAHGGLLKMSSKTFLMHIYICVIYSRDTFKVCKSAFFFKRMSKIKGQNLKGGIQFPIRD